ncbi:MAG: helix-turn-helix transcriptional regulator [Ilumatobacter sp.]|nr:helix-turn-helix transcriptional regulator [Ilumatobacter sp.]
MRDIAVIDDPRSATVALDPVRARLLDELAKQPASAAEIAAALELPRQRVNYHLRTLEEHGLVELAEIQAHGGITERRMRATAARFVVSPAAISDGDRPELVGDRLSAGYLMALGGRLVSDLARLSRLAGDADTRLPTFSIDTEIGFASAADRAAFADELTAAVTELAARYHHDDGRPHRLVVAAHPTPPATQPEETP